MKKIWIALLLAGVTLAAQDAKKSETQPTQPKVVVQKLFLLKYADPQQLSTLLSVFGAQVRQSSELHAITVEAAAESMHAIEDAVQKLDTPSAAPKNVDMTVFLLVASESATAGSFVIPVDLGSTVTQLKNTFPFKNYGLLDVLTFQTRTGQRVASTSSGGSLPVGSRSVAVTTTLKIDSIGVQADGHTLRVDRLNAQLRVPMSTGVAGSPSESQFSYQDLGIQTDLDIKEGQKVVVGRLGISHDQALFLVLMAKVL